MFAYYRERLRATQDGDGPLLDHMTLIYGAGMSDSNAHDPLNLPVIVAGGGAGNLKGGRHIKYPKDTPLANLHISLLGQLGVPLEKIGDSGGALSLAQMDDSPPPADRDCGGSGPPLPLITNSFY